MTGLKIIQSVDLQQNEDRREIEMNDCDKGEVLSMIGAVCDDVFEQNQGADIDIMIIITKRGEV